MYPIGIGIEGAIKRINDLAAKGYAAEAFLTAMFTFEKLIRRSLRIAILSRGFTTAQSKAWVKNAVGLEKLEALWETFDRENRRLNMLFTNAQWQQIKEAFPIRNQLVHGGKVYKLETYAEHAAQSVEALNHLHRKICDDYGRDPWKRLPSRRKSKVSWHQL